MLRPSRNQAFPSNLDPNPKQANAPEVFAACLIVGLNRVSCIVKKTCKLQLNPSNSILMLSAFSNHRRQDSFALMIFTCSCTTFLPAGVK